MGKETIQKPTPNKNLIVFNAIGKITSLGLIEHAIRHVFKPDEWDCVAYMFAKEDRIPDNNTRLQRMRDELGCNIIRRPGLFWGDYLQLIAPVFVSNYDYITISLDDVFMPTQGRYPVNATRMIQSMQTHDIDVISPGIIGDTHNQIKKAKYANMSECIFEIKMIETYVQTFTRDAWSCYYKMLHHTGSRGWCYDICFSKQCPHVKMAYDFSMRAWHMGTQEALPMEELNGTDLVDWAPEKSFRSEKYHKTPAWAICKMMNISRSNIWPLTTKMNKIAC